MLKNLLVTLMAIAASTATAATEKAELGKPVKDFEMTDSNGNKHKFSNFKGKTIVLEWLNYGCPFVRKHYDAKNMQKLQAEAKKDGVIWLSVISSHKGAQGYYEGDALNEKNKEEGNQAFATILDTSGAVGKYFDAKVTPHMYVINGKGELVYRGGIDDIKSSDVEDIAKAKNYVAAALADVKAGRKVEQASTDAYGCGVKYKK